MGPLLLFDMMYNIIRMMYLLFRKSLISATLLLLRQEAD